MNENEQPQVHRSGFVAVIGVPNAGKSTLVNKVLGEKIAITSDKPQTTRHRILGVWTGPGAQIIFLDTPGVHKARSLLNRELVAQALGAIPDVDLVLVVIDPFGPGEDEKIVLEALENSNNKVLLAINKIDRMEKPELLPLMEAYQKKLSPTALVPVSALTGENLDALMQEAAAALPEGPEYYPPDTLTDQPERFIAAEMIREQVFRRTGREIPYSVAVTVEEFKERSGGLIKIRAEIHVERESQKKIIIGKKGSKLKEIGAAARRSIERMVEQQVFLDLFVRVQKNWTRDPNAIKRFGYK